MGRDPRRARLYLGLWVRDRHELFADEGVRVLALSTQDPDYQRELAERIHLPFPVLSDERLELVGALQLPTFDAGGSSREADHAASVIHDGHIEHVFYPVFPPDAHAGEVLNLARLSAALADSEQKVFWLDSPDAPEPLPPLRGRDELRARDRRRRLHRAVGGATGRAG